MYDVDDVDATYPRSRRLTKVFLLVRQTFDGRFSEMLLETSAI